MRIRVLRCAVLLACALSTSVALAQRSSAERSIDAPLDELATRPLWEADVAFAGEQFLVVWIEQRLASDAQALSQLFAARVTPAGRVLDPRGIPIATAGAVRRAPRVVASGSDFVVLWHEERSVIGESARLARVNANGQVLDPEGTEFPFYVAALGCAGARCLGASAPARSTRVLGFDVCAEQSVSSELSIPPHTSSQSSTISSTPRIASGGCGHVLAFAQHEQPGDETSLTLVGFGADGSQRFLRTVRRVPAGGTLLPAFDMAANGRGEALLVWQAPQANDAAQSGGELWTLRCDREGMPLSEPTHVGPGTSPALAFDGDGYVLISAGNALSARKLDAYGHATTEPVSIRAEPAELRDEVRVAAGAQGALVVWRTPGASSSSERTAARLDPHGALLDADGLAIAAAANRQWWPKLVRAGAGFVLLFHDDRRDAKGPRVLALDTLGRPRGEAARVFESELAERTNLQLIAAGERLALVSGDESDAQLAWLDPDSHLPGPSVHPLDPRGSPLRARLAPAERSILALISGRGRLCGEDQACDTTLSLVLLDEQGHADAARPGVTYGPDGAWARSDALAAYDGHGFAVAFSQARVEANLREAGVRVVHVEPDGSVPAAPIMAAQTPEGSHDASMALSPSSDGYLLVLARTGPDNPRNRSLYAMRLGPDLTPLDATPFALTTQDGERAHVSASYDGDAWWVAWQERRGEGSWDVRAAHVLHSGDPAATPFGVAVSPRDELNPTLAAAEAGRALVAYERFDDDPAAMTGRIFMRDLSAADSCSDPECCDGECRARPAARCDAAALPSQTCPAAPSPSARHARYGCGCQLGAGTRASHASLLALWACVWRARRASARARPR